MSLGKFFRRAIAPVARVVAPVVGLVNPLAGAALSLVGGSPSQKTGRDSPVPVGALGQAPPGGIDDAVREQARRLVQATERSLPSLASAGLSAAIKSRTSGQPEQFRFLPLPAGLVSVGQAQLQARESQREARSDQREQLRQQSCSISSDRPASLVVNITNRNVMEGMRRVDVPRHGATTATARRRRSRRAVPRGSRSSR